MNKRIKELAKQAGFASDRLGHLFGGDEIEKFAEAIVKECAKVINADIEFQIKDGVISNVHGLNQARELIKEHFGVK